MESLKENAGVSLDASASELEKEAKKLNVSKEGIVDVKTESDGKEESTEESKTVSSSTLFDLWK